MDKIELAYKLFEFTKRTQTDDDHYTKEKIVERYNYIYNNLDVDKIQSAEILDDIPNSNKNY